MPAKNPIKIQVIDEDEPIAPSAPKKTASKAARPLARKTSAKTVDLKASDAKKLDKTSKPRPAKARKAVLSEKNEGPANALISEIKEPEEKTENRVKKLISNLSVRKEEAPSDSIQSAPKAVLPEIADMAIPNKLAGQEVKIALQQKSGEGIDEETPDEKPIDNFDKIIEAKSQKITEVIKSSILVEDKEKKEKLEQVKGSGSGRSIKLYRRIAYFFIALTLILILVVSYYALVRVDITLISDQERISNNLIFDVFDQEKNPNQGASAISGIVKKIEVSAEKNYIPSGEETVGEEVVGKIIIYNNYTKNQPLVASTRLISSDGKLYRLKSTVNVPSGGQAEGEIYADKAEPEMVVQATKFTIPGLWAGLQDKIFAENAAATVYQKKIKRFVAKDDIENAERDLKQLLLVKAKDNVNQAYKDYSQILYKINENSIKGEIEASPGDKIESFPAMMSAEVVVVAFDNAKASNLARQKFISSLSQTKELISFEDDKVMYSLNSFDVDAGSAGVDAQFTGKVSLKSDSDVIEVDKILGLNDGQLNAYLSEVDGIAGFEVVYRPSFIKRVPRLIDRVNISVKR